ncbi:unnamed protein product [Cochlearia groenlandica]
MFRTAFAFCGIPAIDRQACVPALLSISVSSSLETSGRVKSYILCCPPKPMSNCVLISMLYVLKDWMGEHFFNKMEKIDRNTAVEMIPDKDGGDVWEGLPFLCL